MENELTSAEIKKALDHQVRINKHLITILHQHDQILTNLIHTYFKMQDSFVEESDWMEGYSGEEVESAEIALKHEYERSIE